MKTVLLVTADAALHTRLLAVLTDALRFERGVATHSLLEACQCTSADVALVDLAIPDAADSLGWGHWKICHPNTRLAILFDAQTQHALHLACAAGAIGFFPRVFDSNLLAERLRDVAHGIHVWPNVEFPATMQGGAPKMLPPPQPSDEANRLRLNTAQRMASVGDKTISLSPLECKLLNYLAANANRAVSKGELLEIVWQCSPQADGKAAQVKNCIKRLRQKIEPDSKQPRYLLTVRGQGYQLCLHGSKEDETGLAGTQPDHRTAPHND